VFEIKDLRSIELTYNKTYTASASFFLGTLNTLEDLVKVSPSHVFR
jgi:hypothetical protein